MKINHAKFISNYARCNAILIIDFANRALAAVLDSGSLQTASDSLRNSITIVNEQNKKQFEIIKNVFW